MPHTRLFIQQYIEGITDVRAILVGDYIEAYTRYNPNNFRMNISSGGSSAPFELNDKQLDFCRDVMERGKFPFAHIDLHILADQSVYLSEIALNGGMKGAQIERQVLEKKKKEILEDLAKRYENEGRSRD